MVSLSDPRFVVEVDPVPVSVGDGVDITVGDVVRRRGGSLGDDERSRDRAREMQKISRGRYAESRARRAQEKRESAAVIMGEVADGLDAAKAASGRNQSVARMADDIVRLMAGLILNGGPQFAPATGQEASNMAKQWASIAHQLRSGRAMDKLVDTTAKDPSDEVVRFLQAAKQRIEAGVVPGQVRQINGGDDDGEDIDE